MLFRKKLALTISALVLSFFFWQPVRAMPIGTLLYRTSNDGNLYGYNTTQLVNVQNKAVKNIYTGHVAIYIGQENGVDYIVEATANGIVKAPAKYFLNSNNAEQIIGAKIPKNITEAQRIKIVELAKKMAESNLSYDFDFKKQKGPNSGEWICVGVTEKIYESANISNPLDLSQLQYNSNLYGIDITPDGFDNFSIMNNETGDCLSKNLEFSKIEADSRTLIPFPEIFGFNAGLEYAGERFFFFPITQYWQNSLENVLIDILLESDFVDDEIRGNIPELAMIFKWSLVNNPNSSINRIINNIIALFSKNNNNLIEDEDNSEENNNDFFDDDLIATSTDPGDSNISDDDLDILDKPDDDENEDNQEDENDNNNEEESDDNGLIIIEEGDEDEEDNNDEENNNNNEEENNNDNNQNDNQNELDNLVNKLLISRIHATLTDDYIELYNPNNVPLNLEELNIRLYKTKTSATPSLILRVGNLNDGSYPGGTIIPAQGKYLIARSSADIAIKNRAQAIVVRSDFTFTGNGYAIYLSQGVVSSDNDEDIIDKVGYGNAIYFEGLPALEILNNHLLVRKAKNNSTAISMKEDGSDFSLGNSFDSNNNNFDFVLINLISEDNNDNNNDDSNNNNNNDEDNNSDDNNDDSNNNNNDNDNNNDNNDNNDEDNNSDDNNNDNENNDNEVVSSPQLLISKIYTTGLDDYIELYNPNDFVVNLETSGIRLHKTKTSISPSLVMRIGNLVDGYYPGGVNISPYGKYLIARASSSEEIRSQAQAIATRSDFTFTGDGYTIYLGNDTISNDNDEDIIDKVGYGNATYYQTYPAPEILDQHLLVRKASASSTVDTMSLGGSDFNLGHSFNSLNNNFDFVLINLVEEEENEEENEEEDDEENNNGSEEGDDNNNENDDEGFLEGEDNNGGFFNYCIDPGLYLNNIIHLWHLDECQGTSTFDFANNKISTINSIWQEGKFGCGLKQYYSQSSLSTVLADSFDSNNFSISFYYKNLFLNSRPTIKFSNSVSGNFFRIMMYPSYTDFYNVPGADSRDRNLIWPNDNNWHLFTWVVNKSENYWAIYRDGQEVYHIEMGSNMFIEVDNFSIKGDNGYNLMDEIILFNRALTPNEINQINDYDLPINSISCQSISPQVPEIINYWNFDETMGELANDLVGQSHMTILPESRVITGAVNNYLKVSSDFPEILVNFINPSSNTDLAMAFWWKTENSSSTNSLLKLMTSEKDIFGLNIVNQDLFCYFNDNNFKANTEELLIPNDGLWHNIVLSYSSYWLNLNLFIDGELKKSFSQDWLSSEMIKKLIIDSSEGDYYLDELSIWNWSLNLADVTTIYNIQKSYFGY